MVSDADVRQNGSDLALLGEVREYLRTHQRRNQSQIQRALKKQKDRVKDALDQLKAAGEAEPIRSGMAVLWRLK